jgi:hypothetical protein
MNRSRFIQNIPGYSCDNCKTPMNKRDGVNVHVPSLGDQRLCGDCFKVKKGEYSQLEAFSMWRKKSESPLIFPNMLFYDGRNVLDIETREYVRLKPVDIMLYYFRVRDEKDYE